MARRLTDPQLLTMALNAVLLENYGPAGHEERRRVGAEALQLGDREGLISAQVLGHMALAQTGAAAGELDIADRHPIAAAEALAEAYDQPLTSAIASWYHGLRRVVVGDLDGALSAYEAAEQRVSRMSTLQGAGDTVTVTTVCAWLSVDRIGELAHRWDADSLAARIYPEMYALALAAAGRIDEASGRPAPIRPDYAFDLHWGVRGLLAIAIDDPDRAAAAYQALLPYPRLLAGAGSAVLVVAPVAEILGDLAAYRGDPAAAEIHYGQAIDIARRAGADHWAERAARAVSRLATLAWPPAEVSRQGVRTAWPRTTGGRRAR